MSYIGQDLRIVDASWKGFTDAFEVVLLVPVIDLSVRREACPASPQFGAAAPLVWPYDISAFPFA